MKDLTTLKEEAKKSWDASEPGKYLASLESTAFARTGQQYNGKQTIPDHLDSLVETVWEAALSAVEEKLVGLRDNTPTGNSEGFYVARNDALNALNSLRTGG